MRSRLTAACVLAWVSALSGDWLSRFPRWMLFTAHVMCHHSSLQNQKSNFSIYLQNPNVLRWRIHINSSQRNEKSFSSLVSTCGGDKKVQQFGNSLLNTNYQSPIEFIVTQETRLHYDQKCQADSGIQKNRSVYLFSQKATGAGVVDCMFA